jgi:predicted nucleic acid-binding protein
MKEKVFLDSGIFIAFLNRRDRWHTHAITLFKGPTPQWLASMLVVSEAYSWFLHRMGEEAARSFRALLASLEDLELLGVDASHHVHVLKMLDRLRGAKLTYVDASSLCFLEHRKISRVWATDFHLALTGAQISP